MSKHTPGPWKLIETKSYGQDVEATDGTSIFKIEYAGDYSGRAFVSFWNDDDARLVAAAPELLAALIDLLLVHDTGDGLVSFDEPIKRARAALAKAQP
jgi:hypothetical protein